MQLSDDEWKERLTPEQYHVLREKGTERAGTGTYLDNDATGKYTCAACAAVLFPSEAKYESTVPGLIGWPSFSEAVSNDAIVLSDDDSLGVRRTEVTCKNCGSHLGHLFPDETSPNGKHYCINSVALDFKKGD